MEGGQSPSTSSAHISRPNVSAVPEPTVARQASNQAITIFLVLLKLPQQREVGAAEVAAAPSPVPADALPLAAACTISSSDGTSKGSRKNEGCGQHENQKLLQLRVNTPP